MLPFRQMELSDRELLAHYLQGQTYENTELSFTNLYIWRKGWDIEICEHEGVLYFSYKHPQTGGIGHMQPVVPLGRPVRPAVDTALADLRQRCCGLDIMGINDEFIARLRQENTEGLVIEEDRDLAEYVYNRDDLDNLPGKRYHSKRNHINKFLEYASYTWQELTPDLLTQCLSISCNWLHDREGAADVDESELLAIKEAVTHMNDLKLVGALLCVDGKPSAFTVGERFRPDMALIHLEKADPTVPGIYAFINQQFIHRHFKDVQFVNREEDMGIPGLRKAKESYYPARLVNKYRIREVQP